MKSKPIFLLLILITALVLLTKQAGFGKAYVPAKSLWQDTSAWQTMPDSTLVDSLKQAAKPAKESALNAPITYHAQDSILTDLAGKYIYLFKEAEVVYQDITIKAGFIKINQDSMLLFARGITDSSGKYFDQPIIKTEGEEVAADSIAYNLKTKKGKFWNTFSKVNQGDVQGFVNSEQVKKINDSASYIQGGLFTTCDNPGNPHFGIRITKGKLTKKYIISGPAFLQIEGITLPVPLPFAFFPKTESRTSGIIPGGPVEDSERGFGLEQFGYYFGFNDYINLTTKASIYTSGSFSANMQSTYKKRYRYSGNFELDFNKILRGEAGTINASGSTDFNFRWRHQPITTGNKGTLTANVSMGSSSYFRNNINNRSQSNRANPAMNSSVSYNKSWKSIPSFNLTSGFNHSQNLQARSIHLNLPNTHFSMQRFNPFNSPNRSGPQRWYHKLGFTYAADFNNQINTTEKLLFKPGWERDIKSGMQHRIPIDFTFNLFKHLHITPRFNYHETWHIKTLKKAWNSQLNEVENTFRQGFIAARSYDLSLNTTTSIYGMLQFKKGSLVQAVRHKVDFTVGYNYKPDFGSPQKGYYQNYQADAAGTIREYNILEEGLYQNISKGTSNSLSLQIGNNLAIKARSNKDSTGYQKITILERLNIGTNYNFAADSLQLGNISFNGYTTLFKKLIINFGGSLDPYQYGYNSQGSLVKINKTVFQVGKLPRLQNFNLTLSTNLNADSKSRPAQKTAQELRLLRMVDPHPDRFIDFSVPWNLSINYAYNYNNNLGMQPSIAQTFNLSGELKLTANWSFTFSNAGYDIARNKILPFDLSFVRRLHCMTLNIQWIPIGSYKSYNATLSIDAAIFKDLKWQKQDSSYEYE